MEPGELIAFLLGLILALGPFLFVFIALPVYWGWLLGRYWRRGW